MWHDDSEATTASSGSTPAGSFQGAGTMCGLGLAGTVRPPSNAHSCARLYWPLANPSAPLRLQRIVAVYVLMQRATLQSLAAWKRVVHGVHHDCICSVLPFL